MFLSMRRAAVLATAACLVAAAAAQLLGQQAWAPGAQGANVGDAKAADAVSADADNASALTATPTPNPHPERELLLAVELCRHGDRTPLYSYPLDTLPLSKWPEGVGQLTAVGERAHYETGVRLRRRYVKSGFLPWSWRGSEVYARSTTIDRTLMSAYSQMAGLYPAGSAAVGDVGADFGGQVPADNTTGLPGRWQPVPIHSQPVDRDGLLIAGANCPRHRAIMAEKARSAVWRARAAAEEPFLAQLGAIVGGTKPLTLHDASAINDIWKVYEAHGVPLQEGVTQAVRQRALDIANWMLLFGNEGAEVRRLRSGLLLNEIAQRMHLSAQRREGRLPPSRKYDAKKFVLYSAHDTTVAAALSALDVNFTENPPYNSTLIWEFWRDTDAKKYLVTVEYNGDALHVPGCPGGSTACEFHAYLAATQAVTLESNSMRTRECMTGFRRNAAAFLAWFKADTDDDVWTLNSGGEQDPNSGVPLDNVGGFSSIRLVALALLTAAAAFGVSKARSQYFQYFPLKEEIATNGGDQISLGPSMFARNHDPRILL